MTAEWESHPGEEQLRVVGSSPEDVAAQVVDAFSRLVEREPGGAQAQRTIELAAADRPALLVELVTELVYLAETEGFVADSADVEMGETTLAATLTGRLTAVDPLVKAATYHGLSFERRGTTWHARVVLDV